MDLHQPAKILPKPSNQTFKQFKYTKNLPGLFRFRTPIITFLRLSCSGSFFGYCSSNWMTHSWTRQTSDIVSIPYVHPKNIKILYSTRLKMANCQIFCKSWMLVADVKTFLITKLFRIILIQNQFIIEWKTSLTIFNFGTNSEHKDHPIPDFICTHPIARGPKIPPTLQAKQCLDIKSHHS